MHLDVRPLKSTPASALVSLFFDFRNLFDSALKRPKSLESPTASNWSLSFSKRLFDLVIALLVLSALALPMLAIALCIRLFSNGPALFVQYRVGRFGHLFRIYKFRSMTVAPIRNSGLHLTREGDSRITKLGSLLRKLKIDELPQFYNILRGDMSLVGPRPKLPEYEAIQNMPYRPGITGAATLAFRHEEKILTRVHPTQINEFYNQHIRPAKARIDVYYMCRASFWSDLRLIGATFLACFTPARTSAPRHGSALRIFALRPQPGAERYAAESFKSAAIH